jgi:hypothetical protein
MKQDNLLNRPQNILSVDESGIQLMSKPIKKREPKMSTFSLPVREERQLLELELRAAGPKDNFFLHFLF